MRVVGDLGADQIEFGELNGVPYIRTDGLGDPHVALRFRVGMADEPLEHRGITHMLEHVVLHQFRDSHLQFNGTTGISLTSFYCLGGPKSATPFLEGILDAVASRFEADQVAHESQVLKAEAATRSTSPEDLLLRERFGADGYGSASFPEYWLDQANPDELHEWSRRFFNASNCTLIVHGPELPNIDFSQLPDGSFQPTPEVKANRNETGFYIRTPGPVLGLGCIERSTAASAAASHLGMRLQSKIRFGAGDAYAPFAAYDPISDSHALLAFGSDFGDGNPGPVAVAVMDTIDELIDTGPTDEEVDRLRLRLEAAEETTQIRRITFDSAAEQLTFRSEEILASTEWRRRASEVAKGEISEVLRTVQSESVYSLPLNAEVTHPRFLAKPAMSDRSVGGQVHVSNGYSDRMEIGRNGAGLTFSDGDVTITMTSETARALLTFDDGAWVLIDDRAASIAFQPTIWHTRRELRKAAEALVADRAIMRVGLRFRIPLFPLGSTSEMVFDIVEQLADDWDNALPISRAFVRGGVILTWLADRNLLAKWVEDGASEDLKEYRDGRMGAADLYQALDGILASDMVLPKGNDALNRLFGGKKPRVDGVWESMVAAGGRWFMDSPELVDQAHGLIDKAIRGVPLGRRAKTEPVSAPATRVASGFQPEST